MVQTKAIMTVLKQQAPTIMIVGGICCGCWSGWEIHKATLRANKILEDYKASQKEPKELDFMDKLKLVGPEYLKPAIIGGSGIALILGGYHINLSRLAATATLATTNAKALQDYKKKTEEIVGKNKATEIHDEVVKDQVKAMDLKEKDAVVVGDGDYPCIDILSGRKFYSTIEDIKRVFNRLNERLMNEMFISVNEYYDELGLTRIPLGDAGFSIDDGLIRPDYTYIPDPTDESGRPCLCIDFFVRPRDRQKSW